MRPCYIKWTGVIALAALAFYFDSEICGLGAVFTWCSIDDEDYR